MKTKFQRTPRRPRVVSALLLTLALVVPAFLATQPASANVTDTGEWKRQSLSDISGVPTEISGVTIDAAGGIYAVDDDGGHVYCLSNSGTANAPNWTGQEVTGLDDILSPGDDLEGLAAISSGRYAIVREKVGGSRTSVVQEVLISGLQGTPYISTTLSGIEDRDINADLDGDGVDDVHGGGAEGLATLPGEDQVLMVREGVLEDGQAFPEMHRLDLRSSNPVGPAIRLLPIDSDGDPVRTDAAGVAIEPGATNFAWVLSQQTKDLRKFQITGNPGEQVGDPLDLSDMAQPEGVAFTADGLHMVVVGEGNSASEIAVYYQDGSLAPLPAGNCTGEQNLCTGASVSATPDPVLEGSPVTATVNTGSCGNHEITRTQVNVWNRTTIDWDQGSRTVQGPLTSATFTGTPNLAGEMDLQATVWTDIRVYAGDGTTFETRRVRQDVTSELVVDTQQQYVGQETEVNLRNARFGTHLNDNNGTVRAKSTPTSWDIMTLANGNVHILNSEDGTYLDLDSNWSNVQTQASPDLGSEWVITTRSNGNIWITNADFTEDSGHDVNRLRTHRFGRGYTSQWGGTPAQWQVVDG